MDEPTTADEKAHMPAEHPENGSAQPPVPADPGDLPEPL